MNWVNLGVVKVAAFLSLRGRVYHDQAKAEYGPVRNGLEGEASLEAYFEDDFGITASSRGCHSGLGRLLFNGLASLQYCRYCVEAPDRPVHPDGLFLVRKGET